MPRLRNSLVIMGCLLGLAFVLAACSGDDEPADRAPLGEHVGQPDQVQEERPAPVKPVLPEQEDSPAPPEPEPVDPRSVDYDVPDNNYEAVEVVAEPEAITVLVNKKFALPQDYAPEDLVEPNVPFIFEEKLEKRKLRREAAEALEALFAAAEEDGILLAGVSGYRSYNTQKGLYNWYVSRDGREAADRYSARPGHSEHSTGLAMDVSGVDGKCAATDCFGDTPEAAWLAEHVYDYGFIIRYPEGKEDITGYKYEPWHLRYVGVEMSTEIRDLGLTLEEYTALRQAMAAAADGTSVEEDEGDRSTLPAVEPEEAGEEAADASPELPVDEPADAGLEHSAEGAPVEAAEDEADDVPDDTADDAADDVVDDAVGEIVEDGTDGDAA